MSCLFCEIISGRTPAHVVLSTPDVVAFLDIRPLFAGHTLVVPRPHLETLPELPGSSLGDFFAAVQRVTVAVQAAREAAGTFVAMNNTVSQSVPHLHVHVVPRNRKDGLRGFFWPRTKYASETEATAVADGIRAALS